jgi:hypothetical protein
VQFFALFAIKHRSFLISSSHIDRFFWKLANVSDVVYRRMSQMSTGVGIPDAKAIQISQYASKRLFFVETLLKTAIATIDDGEKERAIQLLKAYYKEGSVMEFAAEGPIAAYQSALKDLSVVRQLIVESNILIGSLLAEGVADKSKAKDQSKTA